MIRRPPRSTQSRSSAASDVYKRQLRLIPRARAISRCERPSAAIVLACAQSIALRTSRLLLIAADDGDEKEAGGAKRDGLGAGEDDGGRGTLAARDRSGPGDQPEDGEAADRGLRAAQLPPRAERLDAR